MKILEENLVLEKKVEYQSVLEWHLYSEEMKNDKWVEQFCYLERGTVIVLYEKKKGCVFSEGQKRQTRSHKKRLEIEMIKNTLSFSAMSIDEVFDWMKRCEKIYGMTTYDFINYYKDNQNNQNLDFELWYKYAIELQKTKGFLNKFQR